MRETNNYRLLDPLYGDCEFAERISALIRMPLVQRLREIRLSNIDSISAPGIANCSRFEHSVGTAFLAGKTAFCRRLSSDDRLVIQAAALLHDSAIQPFGHLVEEALEYLELSVAHEERWKLFLQRGDQVDVGGLGLQIYLGRQSGLQSWAQKEFGRLALERLQQILDASSGQGRFGSAISSDIDLDNLDNVTRAAYHMGLPVDRSLPCRIAETMSSVNADGVTFDPDGIALVSAWLELRSQVYTRFMLSKEDFVGKVMLVAATTHAYQTGVLTKHDWTLTDRTFLQKLLDATDKNISEPVKRWLTSELWALSDLLWMSGKAPANRQVHSFSANLTKILGRQCVAYRIKDKIHRQVCLHDTTGKTVSLGNQPTQWLLGVGSPVGKAFNSDQNKRLSEFAAEFFGSQCLGESIEPGSHAISEVLPFAE